MHKMLCLYLILILCVYTSYSIQYAITCLQKNEDDILEYWLQYHSIIFGIESLLILDNYSDNKEVINILKKWELNGLKVLWEQGPYINKGDLIINKTKELFPSADLYIPLDIDEFIVSYGNQNGDKIITPFIDLNHLQKELNDATLLSPNCYGLCNYYASVPITLDDSVDTLRYFSKSSMRSKLCKKMFKHIQNVKYLHHGSHMLSYDPDYINNNKMARCKNIRSLGLLHYHNRGALRTITRAITDAVGFGYLPMNTSVSNIKEILTINKLQYFNELIENHQPGNHKLLQIIAYNQEGLLSNLLSPKVKLTNYGYILDGIPNTGTVVNKGVRLYSMLTLNDIIVKLRDTMK